MGLFWFFLFGTLCPFWTWISVSFFRFGKFSATISSNTCLMPFSLSSPSGTLKMQILAYLMLSQRSSRLLLFLFFSFVFLSAVLIGWFLLFCLQDYLCILLYHLVCYLLLLVCLLFQILNYLFLIGSFIFSSSLLKWSVFWPILFPNLVNIFITNV